MKRSIYLVSFVAAGMLCLQAHDLYILPSVFEVAPKSKIQVAFHNGDSFPESEVAPAPPRLRDARLRSLKGMVPVEGLRIEGKRTVGTVDAPEGNGTLLLSVYTAANFIELAADKFLPYLKEEGLSSVIDWRVKHNETSQPGRERYSKYAKSLLVAGAPDAFYRQVVGFPIEIVPDSDPYMLHAGGELPVHVLFRGKPAPDLQIEAAWSDQDKNKTAVAGRTDAQGSIRVPLAAAGKWRLHTLLMERCADPAAADWESFWASLTFEIRP